MQSTPYSAAARRALSCFELPATDGTTHLMLVGELDLVTARRAREAVREAQDRSRTLVCDLGDVWFIDLSGLRVLLDAADHARQTGASMTVAHCPPIVPRMLRALGLEDALELQAASRSRRPASPTRLRAGCTSRTVRPPGTV